MGLLQKKGVQLLLLISLFVWAEPTYAETYTEDFSTTTLFNSATSSDFGLWADTGTTMYDTNQGIPAPFFYKPSTGVTTIAQNGQYLYSAFASSSNGGMLQILDTSTNTFTEVDMSLWAITDFVNEIEYNSGYLYIAWGRSTNAQGGLAIVDVSTPTAPVLQRTFTNIPNAQRLTVDDNDNYVYVVSNNPNAALTVIDVSNPVSPSITDAVALASNATYYDLVEWNDYILIGGTTNAKLTAVEKSNPASIATVTVTGSIALSVAYDIVSDSSGDIVLGGAMSGPTGALEMFSVTAGAGITVSNVATYSYSGGTIPEYLFSAGGLLYTNGWTNGNTQRSLDIIDPDYSANTFSLLGATTYNSPWGGDMAINGGNIYTPNIYLGIIAIDVTDTSNPGTPLYTITESVGTGTIQDVAVFNGQLFAAGGPSQRIHFTDIADPTSMTLSNSATIAGSCEPDRFDVSGGYLYIACDQYVQQFEAEHLVTNIDTGTGNVVADMTATESELYVINGTTLTTWSLATATAINSDTPASTPRSIHLVDGYLLVVTASDGIEVYDISAPTNPALVRTFNPSGTEYDVDVEGAYTFVTGNKIRAFLTSELVNPSTTPTVQSVNTVSGTRIEVDNGYAYLGTATASSSAITVVNVKDPTAMNIVTTLAGDLGNGFAFSDGWAYVADGGTNDVQAIHMTHSPWQTIASGSIDTTADNIDSVEYTFAGTNNGGNVFYYVTNNGGASWHRVNTVVVEDTVTGSYTFATTGSDLRWYALLYSDTDTGFEQAPRINSVELTYDTSTAPTDTTAPESVANPSGSSFTGTISVLLNVSDDNPGSTIYYTTDGSTPTTASTTYTSALTIASTTTLKFFAVDAAGNVESPINTEVYTIDSSTPDTTDPVSQADVVGADGPFTGAINVALTASDNADPNPSIYYTIDGSIPTTSSTLYTGPIAVNADTTIQWFAVDASGNQEDTIHLENYTFVEDSSDTTDPVSQANPGGSTFTAPITVTITASDDSDPSPIIYYSTNGSAPSTSSFAFTDPIVISSTTTLFFFAVDASGNVETVNMETYTFSASAAESTAPTVWAIPEDGEFDAPQTVQLYASDNADPNPTIYYTTDGTEPTATSFVYNAPLAINATTTIKFFARDASGNSSSVVTETYTITNAVTDSTAPTSTSASCTSGVFDTTQNVTITATDDEDGNPAIYYTTDGSSPTHFGFVYTGAFTVSETTTVSFFARDASNNSETPQSITCTVYDSSAMNLTVKGKKKGRGVVRVINANNNKVLKRFTAFKKNGVRPKLVKVNGVKRVATINFKKGKLVKLFSLNGNRLSKKQISKKATVKKITAGNLFKGKKNGEVLIARLNKPAGVFAAVAYGIKTSNNAIKKRASLQTTNGVGPLVEKGYTLRVKKKKAQVRTKKGNKLQFKLQLRKKDGAFQLRQII